MPTETAAPTAPPPSAPPTRPQPLPPTSAEVRREAAQSSCRPCFLKQLAIWTGICTMSAAPSFVLGLAVCNNQLEIWAMVIGVAIFILGYTAVTSTAIFHRIKRSKPRLRRTLYIGYGTRICISILYPISIYLDMVCGVLSIGAMNGITGNDLMQQSSFGTVLATTLLQGVVLNIILLIYMGLVYLPMLMFWRVRKSEANICLRCGYDLRASSGVCPECGTSTDGGVPVAVMRRREG